MKSNASGLLELMRAVYQDACIKCSAEVSDLRDLETIQARVEEEGVSFLTITLPRFSRDFERSLASGVIDPTAFQGFRKVGAIPAFLQGMLGLIFDRETGVTNDETLDTPTLVEAVRQICRCFTKVGLPCTPERMQKAAENFVQVDRTTRSFQAPRFERFAAICEVLWPNLLCAIRTDELVPRHGPGATAERRMGNQKFVWRRWHERLEDHFPFLGNALSVSAAAGDTDEFEDVLFVPWYEEDPVRVVFVPKTLKAPRVIAIEPVCMQYAQQAVRAALYKGLETYWLTKGQISFTDQTTNQQQALAASIDGRMATIDLSDASDRVPMWLIWAMLSSNSRLRQLIWACRSTTAELPDGTRVLLGKFAAMGSALCFPIEAMYFYTACVDALLESYKLPITASSVYKVTRDVYVYGDDIIVPSDQAEAVQRTLQEYNCKVNADKSFWTGKFRESCGVEAYNGYDVTPVYIRTMPPTGRRQARELVSWIATANAFYHKGYWRTASLMFSTCERFLGDLPLVSPDSSLLGRVSVIGTVSIGRWSSDLHRWETRGWSADPVYGCDYVDGYAALQKCLLRLEGSPGQGSTTQTGAGISGYIRRLRDIEDSLSPEGSDVKHLERSVRRGAVTLKRHWEPANTGI